MAVSPPVKTPVVEKKENKTNSGGVTSVAPRSVSPRTNVEAVKVEKITPFDAFGTGALSGDFVQSGDVSLANVETEAANQATFVKNLAEFGSGVIVVTRDGTLKVWNELKQVWQSAEVGSYIVKRTHERPVSAAVDASLTETVSITEYAVVNADDFSNFYAVD